MVRSSSMNVSSVRPRVNFSIRSTALRVSWTRSRQSLRGTDSLREDDVAQLAAQAARGREIDSHAEDFLQAMLNPEQVEVSDGLGELGEQVDVAVGPRLVASDRP